jgi:hypothetical protein
MFASSQQYFSFTTNQSPAVLFSQNKQAPAISHQPNEQAGLGSSLRIFSFFTFFFLFFAKIYDHGKFFAKHTSSVMGMAAATYCRAPRR